MINAKNIKSLQLTLASPEQILKWARGTRVTKSETINYKSLKPEEDGLFCQKIFGPVKDYECACGKYKKVKYKGKVCEVCGVEIISSSVRRERMSCIELAYPCTHIWMSKELPNPSKISLLLGMTYKEVEQVIYFVNYVVIKNPRCKKFYGPCQIIPINDPKGNEKARQNIRAALEIIIKDLEKEIKSLSKNTSKNLDKIKELNFDHEMASQYAMALKDTTLPFSLHTVFALLKKHLDIEISIGSAAIKQLLQAVDLNKKYKEVKAKLASLAPSNPKFTKEMNTLKLIKWFQESKIKPEWMVLDYIPVTPPETRPIVQLDNGKFTTSDINTFYRKIIIRNERLKKMMSEPTPEVILNNERRMLQESVDGLFDNASKSNPAKGKDKAPLKSLTDHLKSKQGLFRQNLLGKRVYYSGRSVIVVGPELKMYEAGIPSVMILELFKPYIIHKLITKIDDDGLPCKPIATNIKEAEKMILRQDSLIWPIVNEVVKTHPILLNRAPTLHRLGVQAFEPKIVDGKAIRLHPLVTTAFNADFDGDQMGVYLPLSKEAIAEARSILLASWHILGPKDGKPIVTPTQDMILGAYYISQEEKGVKGQGTIFANPREAKRAYHLRQVNIHAVVGISTNAYKDKGLPSNCILVTSMGKIMFNDILPATMPYINDGKDIDGVDKERIIPAGENARKVIEKCEPANPFTKKTLQKIVDSLYGQFEVDVTAKTMDAIKNIGFDFSTKSSVTISAFDLPSYDKKLKYFVGADATVAKLKKQFNKGLLTDDERYKRVIDLWSKVKNDVTEDVKQILADPDNRNNPVIIMANSGARGNESQFTQLLGMRGLMSKSYNYDQKTKSNVIKDTIETPIKHSFLDGLTIAEYFNASYGARKGMADTAMKTSKSGYMTRKLVDAAQEVIVKEEDCGTPTGLVVRAIEDTKQNYKIESLADRIANRYAFEDIISPKTDKVLVAKNEIITPAMAARIEREGIKEVTIRSVLHCQCKDGICQKCFGNDLTTNKPIEIGTAIGVIAAQSIGEPGTQLTMRTFHTGGAAGEANITQGFERLKQLFDLVPPAERELAIIAKAPCEVKKIEPYEDGTKIYVVNDVTDEEVIYYANLSQVVRAEKGDHLEAGDKITEGSINIKYLLDVAGIESVRDYLIKEVQKVYRLQGIEISDKYIEIIVRQLTNKLKVLSPGDSQYFIGETTDINTFTEVCNELFAAGKELPTAKNEIYGLDNVATSKKGPFLAAASFQDTKKILTDAAIRGDVDTLMGLKENVMIGNLLPVGTGLERPEDVVAKGDEMYKKEY
ncbi:MAG: DNA-directed RNA polymerase subunit beta' [Mycoplasmoidaceae bacterium]